MKRAAVIASVSVFAVIVAAAVTLTLVKRSQIAAAANQPAWEPVEAITMAPARTTQWQTTSDLVGTVIALRSVSVQNEVEGVVTSVGFHSGDIVEAGSELIRLDDAQARAELASAQAALRVAQAEIGVIRARIELAESELRRQEIAAENRATSSLELDRARSEVVQATAELDRAQASVDEQAARVAEIQVRLDKHVIRAPFRGRVGLRTVHEGQFLAQQMGGDSAPIATIQEVSDRIFIDFAIPQEHLSRVVIGTIVQGVIGSAGSLADPQRPIALEVAAIDAQVNNETRNVRVRAVVDNRDQALRPGMFVKIRVPIEEPTTRTVVPVTAVRRASYADQVFVIEEGKAPDGSQKMTARQRFVRLGPTLGEDVIILEGLREGEVVATSGSFKLRDGAAVMPGQPAGPAQSVDAPQPAPAG